MVNHFLPTLSHISRFVVQTCQMIAGFGQARSTIAEPCPTPANLVEHRQSLVNQVCAKFGQPSPRKLWPTWTNLARIVKSKLALRWTMVGRNCKLARFRPNLGPHRPMLVERGPNLRCRGDFRQLWGTFGSLAVAPERMASNFSRTLSYAGITGLGFRLACSCLGAAAARLRTGHQAVPKWGLLSQILANIARVGVARPWRS